MGSVDRCECNSLWMYDEGGRSSFHIDLVSNRELYDE